ncbi:MAG: hypothetical protein ACC658_05155 [Acidimicrobiia bacterium]
MASPAAVGDDHHRIDLVGYRIDVVAMEGPSDQGFGPGDGALLRGDHVGDGPGGGDPTPQHRLGPRVDGAAHLQRPTGSGFELREVELLDPVPRCGGSTNASRRIRAHRRRSDSASCATGCDRPRRALACLTDQGDPTSFFIGPADGEDLPMHPRLVGILRHRGFDPVDYRRRPRTLPRLPCPPPRRRVLVPV